MNSHTAGRQNTDYPTRASVMPVFSLLLLKQKLISAKKMHSRFSYYG